MEADELRALQAPLKQRYKADPSAAVIRLRAEASLEGEGVSCKLETGRAMAAAGLHPLTGGSGLELCSGDLLLESLVACAGVTMKAVATALGVEIRAGKVSAEGDFDARGTLGIDRTAPVGLTNIRLSFALDTDAPQDELASLLRLTERYCVVLQTLRNPPEIEARLMRTLII